MSWNLRFVTDTTPAIIAVVLIFICPNKNIFNGNDFANRKSFIGCALSHYNIWLNLIKDNENEFYIIFEDDITLCNNFEYYLDKNINRVIELNYNLDILFIGFTKFFNYWALQFDLK